MYYILAAVIYITGATYTYKKERWEYKQEMIHYQGDRPDTLAFVKNKYKQPKRKQPKFIIDGADTTENGDIFRTGHFE